jgi:hypothetical protein
MRSFILACIAAVVIAVAAAYVLNIFQEPVSVAFRGAGAQI